MNTSIGGAIEVRYTLPGDPWEVRASEEHITEILTGFTGRKRAFLIRLLNGYSKSMAARSIGLSVRTTQLWVKQDPAFAEAVEVCEQLGFGVVIESELYRRALAGPSDPSSMRALELVVRSRRAEYRRSSIET